jgi:hypothetical protein
MRCERCGEPSVVSQQEHDDTGLPHLCAHHLYESGIRPEDGPSEEELEEMARRTSEIRGMEQG